MKAVMSLEAEACKRTGATVESLRDCCQPCTFEPQEIAKYSNYLRSVSSGAAMPQRRDVDPNSEDQGAAVHRARGILCRVWLRSRDGRLRSTAFRRT